MSDISYREYLRYVNEIRLGMIHVGEPFHTGDLYMDGLFIFNRPMFDEIEGSAFDCSGVDSPVVINAMLYTLERNWT